MCCHSCCTIHERHSWRERIQNSIVFGAYEFVGSSLNNLANIMHITCLYLIKFQLCWYFNSFLVRNHDSHDVCGMMPCDRLDLFLENLWYENFFLVNKSTTHYQILLPKSINELNRKGLVLFVMVQSDPIMNSLCKNIPMSLLALHIDRWIQENMEDIILCFHILK